MLKINETKYSNKIKFYLMKCRPMIAVTFLVGLVSEQLLKLKKLNESIGEGNLYQGNTH